MDLIKCNPFHEHNKPVNQQLNVQVVIYNTIMKVYQQLKLCIHTNYVQQILKNFQLLPPKFTGKIQIFLNCPFLADT